MTKPSVQRSTGVGTLLALCVLTALWLWCRNGGTTTIRLVADKDQVKAYIDGRLIAVRQDKDVGRKGGIAIWYDRGAYWGMPIPQTPLSVKVTDTASGKVLLTQDFRRPLVPVWTERTEGCEPGPLGYRCDKARSVRLGTGYREWENYTFELTMVKCAALQVICRYRDPGNYVEFSARPFRELDSGLVFVTNGGRKGAGGEKPHYRVREIIKNILFLFLYHFPL